MKWDLLTQEQLTRLAECRSRKSDIVPIARCYKVEKNLDNVDALEMAFEHLDANGQYYDPTPEEYDKMLRALK